MPKFKLLDVCKDGNGAVKIVAIDYHLSQYTYENITSASSFIKVGTIVVTDFINFEHNFIYLYNVMTSGVTTPATPAPHHVQSTVNTPHVPASYGSSNTNVAGYPFAPAKANPKFRVGDELVSFQGKQRAKILDVDVTLNSYKLETNSGAGSLTYWDDFTFIDKAYTIYMPELDVKVTKDIVKKCHCDSRALFLKGCQCGAVKPYKIKMG